MSLQKDLPELSEFFDAEIMITLPKQQVQRLHDVFQNAVQNLEDRIENGKLDAKEERYQERYDFAILDYLNWVLRQSN
ncbi:MAG: hypothetical protein RLZZ574_2129 [Cyanobacteriota bacterium]|jgi:hypothetical protein